MIVTESAHHSLTLDDCTPWLDKGMEVLSIPQSVGKVDLVDLWMIRVVS